MAEEFALSRFEALGKLEPITFYLPRDLTDEEKRYPPSQKLEAIKHLVNQLNDTGATPLIRAVVTSRVKPAIGLKAIRYLVYLGAHIDQKVKYGATAVYFAEIGLCSLFI